MTSKKSFLIILILLSLCFAKTTIAQQLKVKNAPKREYLMERVRYVQDTIVPLSERNADYWKVFSNSEQSAIRTEANSGALIIRNAQMLEAFYVVDEKEKWVQVVPAVDVNAMNGVYAPNMILGWVKKTDMLLFSEALKMRTLAYCKAIFTASMSNLYEDYDPSFYMTPHLIKGLEVKVNGKIKQAENVIKTYFVYAETDSSILLGERQNFDKSPQATVVGWANRNSLQLWNTKVCFEPNYRQWSWTQRNASPWQIFSLKNIDNNSIWRERPADMATRPWPATQRRFNYIDTKGDSIVCGAFVRADNINIQNLQYVQDQINQYCPPKINIVFVIDGSASMGGAFDAVNTALTNITNEINGIIAGWKDKFNTTANISWAASVYRDTQSKDRGKVFNLGTPINTLRQNLTWSNQAGLDSPDTSPEEAVFWGLKRGLELFNGHEKETNLVIMIGDTGDHHRNGDQTSVNSEEIINLIRKANVNLLNYQFQRFSGVMMQNNTTTDTYGKYVSDFQEIMRATMAPFTQTLTINGRSFTVSNIDNTVSAQPVGGSSKLSYFSATSVNTSKLVFLTNAVARGGNNSIDSKELSRLATDDIYNVIKSALFFDYILRNISNSQDGFLGLVKILGIDMNNLQDENPSVVAMINRFLIIFKNIENILNNQRQIYLEGWFPYSQNQNVMMFDHFIDHQSFQNMLTRFQSLAQVQNVAALDVAVHVMLAELLGIQDMVIGGPVYQSLNNYTIVDFLSKLMDHPAISARVIAKYPQLVGIKVGDIVNPAFNNIMVEISTKFRNSYNALNAARNKNEFAFEYNGGTRFYYVPTDLYPYCGQ
jgi:hypothetical protein